MQTTAGPSMDGGVALAGKVHGGNQPVAGARVYLMAANTTGYGQASVSLLNAGSTGHADSTGAYVVSDAGGSFSITDDYSCTTGQQVYLLALGGDAGAGENSSAALMAALGACPASGSFAAQIPFVWMNEVTTVAAAYSLAGFMTDATHVSSSGTAQAKTGVANAFLTAANLANVATGSANTTTVGGNGTVPQSTINTLANILAACINGDGAVTSSPSASNCYTLFSNATSDGTSVGTQPTETVTAAVNLAHHPWANVSALYGLQAGVASPFQPNLSVAPNDLTVALNVTGGGLVSPTAVAVDGDGNIWTANDEHTHNSVVTGDSASKFAAGTAAALSPETVGYTGGGIRLPFSMAIDPSGNVWLGDVPSGGTVADAHITKLANDGTPVSSTGYNLGILGPLPSIAIDANGDPLVSNRGTIMKVDGSTGAVTALQSNSAVTSFALAADPNGNLWEGLSSTAPGVYELDNTGSITFPSGPGHTYYGSTSGITNAVAVAIDHAGNVWVGNGGLVNASRPTGVAKFSDSGSLLTPPAIAGFAMFYIGRQTSGLVVDGDGNVFVSAPTSNCIGKLSSDGTILAAVLGLNGPGQIDDPAGIAVDPSGNVWVPNFTANSLTELVGVAAPVVTPIAAGVANNTLGTRP